MACGFPHPAEHQVREFLPGDDPQTAPEYRPRSRENVAAHWPGQPTARISPPPGIVRLK